MITEQIEKLVKDLATKSFRPVEAPEDEYTKMKWPHLIPLMRFGTEHFSLAGFGHAAFVRTKCLGFVHLLTCSLTPDEGAAVPYLMIEVMEAKGRYTVIVEYYDCTANGADTSAMEAVAEKYASVEDYPEKPVWYTKERAKGSVSKFAVAGEEATLVEIVRESVEAYLKTAKNAEKDQANMKGLCAFADRMVTEGNPLSETFNSVLGKTGAEEFFRKVVMPLDMKADNTAPDSAEN